MLYTNGKHHGDTIFHIKTVCTVTVFNDCGLIPFKIVSCHMFEVEIFKKRNCKIWAAVGDKKQPKSKTCYSFLRLVATEL